MKHKIIPSKGGFLCQIYVSTASAVVKRAINRDVNKSQNLE